MDILFEQRIIQNEVLAGEAIWQAIHSAFESKARASGVAFPLAFIVLPLVFHRRTANALATKTQPGALYKALAEDPEITVGLQNRMQALSERTFRSLSVAFDTGLIGMDEGQARSLIPLKRTLPILHATAEVKVIMNAAKRIGQAFGEMTAVQLLTHLHIRF
jgi:hypothetical protein